MIYSLPGFDIIIPKLPYITYTSISCVHPAQTQSRGRHHHRGHDHHTHVPPTTPRLPRSGLTTPRLPTPPDPNPPHQPRQQMDAPSAVPISPRLRPKLALRKPSRQPDCIRAHITFTRPTTNPSAIKGIEECWLLSVGSGVDGKAGRGHGGFNALVLDQISGSVSHYARPVRIPPATATMTIDYKAPVETPCVVLLRAWIEELEGRKVWVRGVIEDGSGRALCTSRALLCMLGMGGSVIGR
ncbi:hypothetical protein ABVK25_012374 [Lepraria finkii]|uniref:Thioesterase domain-containing protein n=1 Tax=Lepraria finkii TaxID=1340010 RepID=A0ABR4AFG7_9LECA